MRKECLYCEKFFDKSISISRRTWQRRKYCSKMCQYASICGRGNPMYGKTHKGYWLGKRFSEEHKMKIGQAESGAKHYNWKGGIPNCEVCGKRLSSRRHLGEPLTRCMRHRIFTEEMRRNIGNGHKGEKSHLWRGGITPLVRAIRTSLEYKLWREKVFRRDNWTCRFCSQKGKRINADHIKPFAHFPKLRFLVDNGRTLCEDCHKNTDTYGYKSRNYQTLKK